MRDVLRGTGAPLLYIGSVIAFVLGVKSIARVRTASTGRPLLLVGLVLAFLGAVFECGEEHLLLIGGSIVVGAVVGTALMGGVSSATPASRLAILPGLGGGAAALLGRHLFLFPVRGGTAATITAAVLAGVLGLTSLVLGVMVSLGGRATTRDNVRTAMTAALAGWAVALAGVAAANVILVAAGGLAGTTGFALGRLVAGAAHRPLWACWLGLPHRNDGSAYSQVRSCGTEEAAMVLEAARSVVVVPGYGMAVAQAQHTVKETVEQLARRGIQVSYLIHPSAGCIPGHMNVMLDEADVPHERLYALDQGERQLVAADVILVVGANDVVNRDGAADPASPLYGMPSMDLTRARSVFVVKRSLRAGTAGVKNPLFEQPNTMMIFGDAKRVMQALVSELKSSGVA